MTKSYGLVREAILNNGDALFHTFVKVDTHAVKKNNRPIHINSRTGRRFLGKSSGLVVAENKLIHAFRVQMMRNRTFETINCPVWAVFWFYFPKSQYFTKKGEMSQRLPDLSNLYQLPEDTLQKAGVIANDKLIFSHDLSRRLIGDEYALEIFLFKYGDSLEKPNLKVVAQP